MTDAEVRKYEEAIQQAEAANRAADRAAGALEQLRKEAEEAFGTSDVARLTDMEEEARLARDKVEGQMVKAYRDFTNKYEGRY